MLGTKGLGRVHASHVMNGPHRDGGCRGHQVSLLGAHIVPASRHLPHGLGVSWGGEAGALGPLA